MISQSESSILESRIIESCMFTLANQTLATLFLWRWLSFHSAKSLPCGQCNPQLHPICSIMKHGRLWESLVALKVTANITGCVICLAGDFLLGWRGEMTQFSFRQVIEFLHKSKALYLPREWSLFVAGCAQRGRSNQGREGWWGWALTRKHFIRYSPLSIDSLPTQSFLSRLFAKFEGWR